MVFELRCYLLAEGLGLHLRVQKNKVIRNYLVFVMRLQIVKNLAGGQGLPHS